MGRKESNQTNKTKHMTGRWGGGRFRHEKKSSTIWASTQENNLRWVANNKGTDQPAHVRSLISAFVIRRLESTISKHASCEISIF